MRCEHCGINALGMHNEGCPEIVAQLKDEVGRLRAGAETSAGHIRTLYARIERVEVVCEAWGDGPEPGWVTEIRKAVRGDR